MNSLLAFIKNNAWLPLAVLVIALGLYQFVDPAPPSKIVLATGSLDGRYYQLGQYLQSELERQGIELELLETAGSGENMALLIDPGSEVSIALVQSGIEEVFDPGDTELFSLGSLYYEPLWLFFREQTKLDVVYQLAGLRVAVGESGSGTRALAQYLLAENGLLKGDDSLRLLEIGGVEAVNALRDGDVDAAFFTVSPSSQTIRALIDLPGVDFLDIRRSPAYTARYPFLSAVTISEGLLDLERNIPSQDHRTLASTATLVVNERFHPAFTPLVLESLNRRLQRGGILERPGEFPSPAHVGVELTPEARHYFESGPPFLLRYLPFWAASLVDRLVIFAIPLLVILIPLIKLAGPLYRWRMRSRIYRWYRLLLETDRKIAEGRVRDVDTERHKLEALANELASVEVPLSFSDELYQLKQHAEYVMRRLNACGADS